MSELEETCGRVRQAADLVAWLGDVAQTGGQAVLNLLDGKPLPSEECCRAVSKTTIALKDACKELQKVAELAK